MVTVFLALAYSLHEHSYLPFSLWGRTQGQLKANLNLIDGRNIR
jgi:hypothetical protein